jgi:N-acetylglutamate synthase-like GNAT family acetyltransferase
MQQLQRLLDRHCFWAKARTLSELDRMLRGSSAIVTAWRQDGTLVGFGRATSDGVFRAVLWDVVVASSEKGQGVGRRLVETLLSDPNVAGCERTYLMTSQSRGFYERLGFKSVSNQNLMRLDKPYSRRGPGNPGTGEESLTNGSP